MNINKIAELCIENSVHKQYPIITNVNRSKLLSLVNDIINSHDDISETVCKMRCLRSFVDESIAPQNLSLSMVDYMSDEGMWQWISSFGINELVKEDFDAQFWIIISLKELLDNNKIMDKRNEC